VLAVPIVQTLIFPTRRRVVSGSNDPVPVANASAVGATPLRVEITAAEQHDAYAKVTNVRLGAAWLVRGADQQIHAFSTTCPHLGCAVDYSKETKDFRCPCHKSAFATDGSRVSGPAKRGLDELETSVDPDGQVRVRFARFKLDVAEREDA
jgi:Rieske Fe-S protein